MDFLSATMLDLLRLIPAFHPSPLPTLPFSPYYPSSNFLTQPFSYHPLLLPFPLLHFSSSFLPCPFSKIHLGVWGPPAVCEMEPRGLWVEPLQLKHFYGFSAVNVASVNCHSNFVHKQPKHHWWDSPSLFFITFCGGGGSRWNLHPWQIQKWSAIN